MPFKIIQRSKGYRLGQGAFDELSYLGLPETVLNLLYSLKNIHFLSKKEFTARIYDSVEMMTVNLYMPQILKSAKVLQMREIIRYLKLRASYRAIRYSSCVNYMINRLCFVKLPIGKKVVIQSNNKTHFIYGNGVSIGDEVKISIGNSRLELRDGVSINANCRISPEKSGIKIGKRSRVQEFGRLLGQVTIGEDVIIAPNFYVSSGVHVFKEAPHLLINIQDAIYDGLLGESFIEDDCWIGMNVCLMPGVRIRRGCVIGAGSIVTRSTEPYGIYGGIPAKKIGNRFVLEPKVLLDATCPENLPYFYQGFDHYHYLDYKERLQGIITDSTYFSIYTELPQVQSIRIELESISTSVCMLVCNNNKFEIKPGINTIAIEHLEVDNKLIELQCAQKLIIRKVFFNPNSNCWA